MRARARTIVLLLLGAWILCAPAARQLGDLPSPWMPAWDMYSDLGLGIVRGRFIASHRGPEGPSGPVDRYQALGFTDPDLAPRWLRTIRGPSGMLRVARALCGRLGPTTILRVNAEIATRDGWAPLFDDVDDLCRPLPPQTIRRGRRH